MRAVTVMLVLMSAMAVAAWLGARWRLDDVYLTCKEKEYYVVRHANPDDNGRVILCTGMTGDELVESASEVEPEETAVVDAI